MEACDLVNATWIGETVALLAETPAPVFHSLIQAGSGHFAETTDSRSRLSTALVVISVLFLFALLYWRVFSQWTQKRFPGPQQFPYIGRVHDLPKKYIWLKFAEWAREHGPAYYTSMLGAKFIIISDEKIAHELLVARGKNFSDRPQIPAVPGHKVSGEYFALSSPTQEWSSQRKFLHAAIAEAAQSEYHDVFQHELSRYMCLLLVDPDNFKDNLEDMASRMICRMTWGDAGLSRTNADSAWQTLEMMSTAGTVANRLTFINKLPYLINPWRRYEAKRHAQQIAWWSECYQAAKSRRQAGTLVSSSWASRYFSALENASGSLLQSTEEEKAGAALLGFSNLLGVYTVAPQISYLMMAFAEHPAWLHACQEEVDRECGTRTPTLKDLTSLSTVKACVKETIRWRPNVPLGVPHQALEDQIYEGVLISRGTTVLPLEWSIARNPARYPDPENWRPERWLEPGWPTSTPSSGERLSLKTMSGFGWGRRACAGIRYAEDMLFLTAATLCWGFHFRHRIDAATGERIAIDTMASNSFVVLSPDAFPLDVRPRSVEREQDILGAFILNRQAMDGGKSSRD